VTEPRTLTELEKVLSQDAPELRVVPSAKYGNLERGMYLCNDWRSWKQLFRNDFLSASKTAIPEGYVAPSWRREKWLQAASPGV
jgi:hypothetical protein